MGVKVGIMQPYFFPYIGYWQLMNAVDRYVIYDVQFEKGGWMNRNRILLNGKDHMFTLPVKADSYDLDVNRRRVADSFPQDRRKLLNQLRAAYGKAPNFASVYAMVEDCLNTDNTNLFDILYRCNLAVIRKLGISTEIIIASSMNIPRELKGADRVMATCKALGATEYYNAIGGTSLYSFDAFAAEGISLRFVRARNVEYRQFGAPFVPFLSILDLMMFLDDASLKEMLTQYDLLGPGEV